MIKKPENNKVFQGVFQVFDYKSVNALNNTSSARKYSHANKLRKKKAKAT